MNTSIAELYEDHDERTAEPDACERVTCDNCGDATNTDQASSWVFTFDDAGHELTLCPACEFEANNYQGCQIASAG